MRNQRGITLVELLAVITLLSLVSLLIIGIIIQAQGTYKRNQVTNFTTTEISLLVNSVTRDIRQFPEGVSVSNEMLNIQTSDGEIITYKFDSVESSIKRNDNTLLRSVTEFVPILNDGLVTIEIKDNSGKKWTSTIVIRKGGDL
nr:prepilin-type N-terminal cleavage/methylation domain-containing protein [Pseudoalteromonas profundi]